MVGEAESVSASKRAVCERIAGIGLDSKFKMPNCGGQRGSPHLKQAVPPASVMFVSIEALRGTLQRPIQIVGLRRLHGASSSRQGGRHTADDRVLQVEDLVRCAVNNSTVDHVTARTGEQAIGDTQTVPTFHITAGQQALGVQAVGRFLEKLRLRRARLQDPIDRFAAQHRHAVQPAQCGRHAFRQPRSEPVEAVVPRQIPKIEHSHRGRPGR